jgi:hypothetical protein
METILESQFHQKNILISKENPDLRFLRCFFGGSELISDCGEKDDIHVDYDFLKILTKREGSVTRILKMICLVGTGGFVPSHAEQHDYDWFSQGSMDISRPLKNDEKLPSRGLQWLVQDYLILLRYMLI